MGLEVILLVLAVPPAAIAVVQLVAMFKRR